jgi:hypothetical protein
MTRFYSPSSRLALRAQEVIPSGLFTCVVHRFILRVFRNPSDGLSGLSNSFLGEELF